MKTYKSNATGGIYQETSGTYAYKLLSTGLWDVSVVLNESLRTKPLHYSLHSLKYVVWSKEHVSMAGGLAETYEQLLAYEEDSTYSYSSYITTDDIESIVSAVQNEWNGDLEYHLYNGDQS